MRNILRIATEFQKQNSTPANKPKSLSLQKQRKKYSHSPFLKTKKPPTGIIRGTAVLKI
jgi:hypothetical protein